MRASKKWVVQQHQVAVAPFEAADDVGHRVGHAAEVHGNVCGLSEQRADGVEQRAAEVEPVLDVR